MPAPRPILVLVVDDDQYTRVFVRKFLPSSMRTAAAADGREALDLVRNDPPDVIVMDLDMPVMGGLEAATLIRQWEAQSGRLRCAMIAMSSHDDPAVAARCEQAGFDRHLAKPVSPDAIRRAVAELARDIDPAQGPEEPVWVNSTLRNVLPGFLLSRRALVDELGQAVAGGDAERVRALAHKLGGSCALYGFLWAATQGKMIERRAADNALEGLAGEVAALRRHLDAVCVEYAQGGLIDARGGNAMFEKYKLLVVDDDDAVIDYLHAHLGERYAVVSTNAPERVLHLARKERPNLILCDIDMPGMDGGDVSKDLYDDAQVRDIPVLFITRLASPAEMQNLGHQIGGRSAISKQAPIEELAKRIESLIK